MFACIKSVVAGCWQQIKVVHRIVWGENGADRILYRKGMARINEKYSKRGEIGAPLLMGVQ
jgi:hypothetical protein